MIPVDRKRIIPPKRLHLLGKKLEKQLEKNYKEWRSAKGSAKRPVHRAQWKIAKPALKKLFHGKCAYCESPVTVTQFGDVDQFRPKRDAAGLDSSDIDAEHYWWLAYEWENLYFVCQACNVHKRNLFPVDGRRVKVGERGSALLREKRLLLDPCHDDPSQSLKFSSNGRVTALDSRGEVSIRVFGLNREALVTARAEIFRHAQATVKHLKSSKSGILEPQQMAENAAPYAAVARQVFRRANLEAAIPEETVSPGPPDTAPTARQLTARKKSVKKRAAAPDGSTKRQRQVARAARLLEAVWIDKIDIVNFRSIQECTLEFPTPVDERQPWLMLIGKNGVGKSSILQALAIANCPPAARRRWIKDAGSCTNREADRQEGHIRIEFSNGKFIQLAFSEGEPEFRQKGARPMSLQAAAYGSTRLPPGFGVHAPRSSGRVRVDNLFNPFVPLSDAEKWIANVERVQSKDFKLLREGLAKLLSLDNDGRISRKQGVLYTHIGRIRDPFSDQSDGYRSIVCLATDLMKRLSKSGASMKHAVGTVLLDEIEGHLHPEWKIRIVSMLREVFPSVRFVVTTHDPLCLRGLHKGEVHQLRRDVETRIPKLTSLEIPPGIHADQLLTGSWFELPTTLDRQTEAEIEEHRRLLRKQKISQRDQAELEKLEFDLRKRMNSFPSTSLERMVAEIAAREQLRMLRDLELEDRQEIRRNIEKKLQEFLAERQNGAGS